mgnify:CR=1 FL=1
MKKRINTAAKGRRLEHKTIKVLKRVGYDCMRSAASKGTWDVIAIGPVDIRLVQVKANRPPGPIERENMAEAVAPPNATKEFWVWKDGEREPYIELVRR